MNGQGTISGLITDPAGAVLVGAKVTITNINTNVAVERTTNTTGYYEADALNPGEYKIEASAQGFQTIVRSGITLQADAYLDVALKLAVGNTSQVVQVTAGESLLNTESGSSGQVLTTRQLESLPASGSNPAWLLEMAPGVQTGYGQTASQDGTLNWNGVSNFGANGVTHVNEYSLDGAPNMDGRSNGINPTQDALGEMKADVSGFDASIGHTMGVSVTQTTKSGTNQLHGALRTVYQPKRWFAMDHFQGLNYRYQQSLNGCTNGASTSPACFADQYKYGLPGTHEWLGLGSVGGPVVIPGLYNGRDKLFFFVSVMEDLFTGVGASTSLVPTLQERGGDFSDLLGQDPNAAKNMPSNWNKASAAGPALCPGGQPYAGQYQIYNPFSVALTGANGAPQRQPFCGNVVPSSLIGQGNVGKMVSLYNSFMPNPTQNAPTGNNFTSTNFSPQTYRDWTGRGDYAVSQNDHLFVRYSRDDYTALGESAFNNNVGEQDGPRWIDVAAVGWNHLFSSKTNLDFTVGGTNFRTHCCYYPNYDKYYPSSIGLPSYADTYAGALHTLPKVSVSSYNGIGNVDNAVNLFRDISFRANLTHVQGKHTIRAGGEFRFQNTSQGEQGNPAGTYNFDDTYTQENNGTDNTFQQNNVGLAYAAFLMGVQTSNSASTQAPYSISSPYYAFYAGDTWRVKPKLTVVPGIRFEYEYGIKEKHNEQIVGWNPTASLPIAGPANTAYQSILPTLTAQEQSVLPTSLTIQGGPIYAGVNGASNREWVNSYRIMPRLAVAYQIRPDTVIRGGYGLFFDTLNAGTDTIDQDGFSASTSQNSSTSFGTNFSASAPPMVNPFPSGFNAPVGNAAGALYYLGGGPTIYDHNFVPARMQRGQVGVQHQFGRATMVEVNWVGALTTHLSVGKSQAFTPAQFYTGGFQPNSLYNSLLGQNVPNPFLISNFSGVASSNPAGYNIMAHSTYYTGAQTSLSNLVRAYPQMTGLTLNEPIGESKFQELQVNVTRRYDQGLTLTAGLQFNNQKDRDYFYNPFDPWPSWEASNTSLPVRFTAEGVWTLPLGRGKAFANSGWKSAVFGGFQFAGSYEAATGDLITFGNLFYMGTPHARDIKIKNPPFYNLQPQGGSNYVQWLNQADVATAVPVTTTVNGVKTTTCSYSGTGFVTNTSCQPNGYNLRVFPRRISGVRQMGLNGANANGERSFNLGEKGTSLVLRFEVYNLFNHEVIAAPNTTVTSSQFGWVTSDGFPNSNQRWVNVSGRIRF
jgi:hypothetical protein